jgi:hypothetical protein
MLRAEGFLYTCRILPLGDRQCQAVGFCSGGGRGRANWPPGGDRGRATRPPGGGRGRATRPHLLTVCYAPDSLLSSGEFALLLPPFYMYYVV